MKVTALCTAESCVDCFKPSSVGYSSPRPHVPENSNHPDVKKLGSYLDRREKDPWHARMSS